MITTDSLREREIEREIGERGGCGWGCAESKKFTLILHEKLI